MTGSPGVESHDCVPVLAGAGVLVPGATTSRFRLYQPRELLPAHVFSFPAGAASGSDLGVLLALALPATETPPAHFVRQRRNLGEPRALCSSRRDSDFSRISLQEGHRRTLYLPLLRCSQQQLAGAVAAAGMWSP
jgi:hypothetical protein